MKYDLIHFAVLVWIKLFVILCESLIKNWMSSWFAVGLLVDPLLCSKSSSNLRFTHIPIQFQSFGTTKQFVVLPWPPNFCLKSTQRRCCKKEKQLSKINVACTTSHQYLMLKFIYSEKAIKFCEISTLLLSYVVPVKSKVEISKILWPSQNI